MSNHRTTYSANGQASGSSGKHSTFPALLFALLDDFFLPAALGVLEDVFCFLAVVSAGCAAVVVARAAHRSACRREGTLRSSGRGKGTVGSLWKFPLGAAGGLFEVVVALAVPVPLGDPAGWEGRAAGRGCVGGRGSAVALGLAVLRLLVVGWLIVVLGLLAVWGLLVVGGLVFGSCGGERQLAVCRGGVWFWERLMVRVAYRHACHLFSRLSSCGRRRQGLRTCRPSF